MRSGISIILLLLCCSAVSAQVTKAFPFQSTPVVAASGWLYTDDFDALSTTTDMSGSGDWLREANTMGLADDAGNHFAYPNTVTAENAMYYNQSISGDMAVEVTMYAVGHGVFSGPAVRCQGGSETYYGVYGDDSNSYLFKVISGSWTQLGSTGNAWSADDVIRLEISGSTLTVYKDDVVDTSVGTSGQATDTDITGGYAGISGYGQDSSSGMSDWKAKQL